MHRRYALSSAVLQCRLVSDPDSALMSVSLCSEDLSLFVISMSRRFICALTAGILPPSLDCNMTQFVFAWLIH